MRSASAARFSRTPSTHKAVIHPPPRRRSPYRMSKPIVVEKKVQRKPSLATSFDDQITYVNKKIKSFSEIECPATTRTIIVKKNEIKSFSGLPSLKELESLDISENPIDSFKDFPNLPKLRSISFDKTPLSNLRNSRIALIILVGPSLRIVNGERIPASDRAVARTFPEETKTLLELGWEITNLPPKKSEIPELLTKLAHKKTDQKKERRVRPRLAPRKLSKAANSKINKQEEEIEQLRKQIESVETTD